MKEVSNWMDKLTNTFLLEVEETISKTHKLADYAGRTNRLYLIPDLEQAYESLAEIHDKLLISLENKDIH